MTTRFRWMIAMAALLLVSALNVQGTIPDDADGDGVPDSVDVCPAEDASGFDRNGDGCIDDAIGARHVEYWGTGDPVVTYVIHQDGAAGVAGTADNDAVIAAFEAWTSIPGTGLDATYGGTTAQAAADGLDQVNLVTFADNAYPFGVSTLAVGLSTSFESDTLIAGRVWRKGEIFDADMLFSPTKTFKVGGAGLGTDIQSVATHEAGHLFGIAHTAVKSATMYYVLPGGLAARSLSGDDEHVYYKGYASQSELTNASRLTGIVRNGQSSDPVGGALVFAIDASNPTDTAACEITLPDGSFDFRGLPDGSYFVSIYPLDGTSNIGFLQAGNVSPFVASYVDTDFLPEYYDAAESNMDNGADQTAVAVSAGATESIEIVTNIDGTPPVVLEVTPASGSSAVAIDGAYLIRFSERVDVGTLGDAVRFRQGGTGIGGNLAIIRDDSVIVFTTTAPLAFSTTYTLTIDTDLRDRAGNALAADFVATFTTEVEPPLSVSSLSPNKGVPGTTIVVNGRGFSTSIEPTVTFDGTPANVVSAAPGRLVVTVPDGVNTGSVVVTNPDAEVSNALVFTVLSSEEIARGYESGTVSLSGTPHAIALSPDGVYAYIAAQGGVEAVVVDAGLGGYLTRELIADPAEFTDVATTPDGKRVYAVSSDDGKMIEIVSDPTAGLLFNQIIATRSLNAEPRGIVVDPAGFRAYIATDAAEVQVWDIRLGSPSYQEQVGVLHSPDGISLPGAMAITPDGSRLLALGGSGEVFFYALGLDSLTDRVSTTLDPRAIAIDPQGERAYVAHIDGSISVVNIDDDSSPFFVQGIATGGSLRGLDTTPAGLYLYATDRGVDNLEIVDLDETHTTFRSVVADAPMAANPTDIAMSSDGVYAYSVLQGDGVVSPRMVVTTIGFGPQLASMVPQAGSPGTKVVITGQQLYSEGATSIEVDFNGVVAPAERAVGEQIIATVPVGATSGPVTVRLNYSYVPSSEASNAIYFEVVEPLALGSGLREAASIDFPSDLPAFCDYVIKTLAFSPDGSYLYAACGGSDYCFVFDIRPGSPTYNQVVGNFSFGPGIASDVAITADGKVSVWAVDGSPLAIYCDPNDPRFGTRGPAFDFGSFPGGALSVATSPDNRTMILIDSSSYMFVDAANLSDGVAPVVVDQNYPPAIDDDIVFHPTGRAAFMLNPMSAGQLIVYNTDFQSANYQSAVAIPTSPGPTSLDVSRDGRHVFVYSGNPSSNFELYVTRVNCERPDSCYVEQTCLIGEGADLFVSGENRFRISPQGLFAIRTQEGTGFIEYDPNCPVEAFYRTLTTSIFLDFAFTPDGRRIYAADAGSASLRMFDFRAASAVSIVSGNNQNGATGEVLPAPIRVRVEGLSAGLPMGGIPITFTALNNGMLLTSDGFKTTTNVATDEQGYAEIQWKLGDLGANAVVVTATGLAGAPFQFSAIATPDPSTLPLALAEVIPLNGTSGVSPTTALLATFSRAIDPLSIGSSTLYLRNTVTSSTVPATYGFTDTDRKVSLTPSAALTLGTAYELVLTAGVQAVGGSALTNPGTSGFTIAGVVPLALESVSPPSTLAGVSIVISGTGFDATPSNNTVLFNALPATPTSGGPGSLVVTVPGDAVSGTVRVTNGSGTSNALPFVVLAPNTSPIDEVIATITAGSGARSCAVSPDGALVYAVGTEGDVVIPVDVEGLTTFSAIPVGDQPVAIVIHPNGKVAYVANFNSGTVSVIDIVSTSPDFNTVVQTLRVGTNPSDLAVDPDGSRLVVANAGSSDISIIDSDATSTTFGEVLATVPSGSGARSVAVSPDGTIYVGTDTGFMVVSASNEVLATVPAGSGGRSVAVSPDGTFLFILTDDGDVLVVDIQDGSLTENQVLATVPAGSGGRSVAVSGDGTLLYVIPEVGDEVLVFSIDVIAGVSATDPNAAAPTFTVSLSPVDTLAVGPEPSDIAMDRSGSGAFYVVNSGNATLSVFGAPAGPVAAEVHVDNISEDIAADGFYVIGRVELPAPLQAQNIDLASVRLATTVPYVAGSESMVDEDNDGIDELRVKFLRHQYQAAVPQGYDTPVRIEGEVPPRTFAGEDILRTVRPVILRPEAGDFLPSGEWRLIVWVGPPGSFLNKVDVHVSVDDGATWTQVANKIPNLGLALWKTPVGYYEKCWVLVTVWKSDHHMGDPGTIITDGGYGGGGDHEDVIYAQGISPASFTIGMTVPTRLKTFDITMEEGTAVLRWETGVELGMEGFAVVRSESEAGVYQAVTKETIRASGQSTGGRYEYRDEGVSANRTYWYKLQEVTEGGVGMEFGPYSVEYRLSYGLDQNMPNPFNPTTTIRYALAVDGPVSLTIYDVKGSRVRELVNERQRADVYRVVWDGSNQNGERVASGMYFYKLVAGKFTQTRKMMLLK